MVEDIIEKAAYDALKETNPSLLEAIETFLAQGGKAKQIERKLTRRYGNGVDTIHCAILAAYHAEGLKKTKRVKAIEAN